jgi:molybdopterin molybdotransferase
MILPFEKALETVLEKTRLAAPAPPTETVALEFTRGRVLADDVIADRDYPPFHRATRDGFAVRSKDLTAIPMELERVGEVRAGERFDKQLVAGQAVEIMTGAPLAEGADAVVMVEHTESSGTSVRVMRAVREFENVVRQGSEAKAGEVVLRRGRRLGPAEIGLLASVGLDQVKVYRKPRVAILPTGDELVPVKERPQPHQIRSSSASALAAQTESAGATAWVVGIAPDRKDELRRLIEQSFEADLVVVTGGVSMGKYDFVEPVLTELGAEFYFQGAAIRPGKPVVFGRARGKLFFGLPGNPVSSMVTFELFVRPALAILSGAEPEPLVLLRARLAKPFRHQTGLTQFLPARVESKEGEPVVELAAWQGSGDWVGAAAANCFLVVHPDQTDLARGDAVDVWPKTWF